MYTPPLKSLPLPVGEDVLEGYRDSVPSASLDIPQNRNTFQDIFMPSISNSIFSQSSTGSFTHDPDDQFNRFLRTIESTSEDVLEVMRQSTDDLTENQQIASPLENDNDEKMQMSQDDVTPENENRLGNALTVNASSWSDPLEAIQNLRQRASSVAIDKHSFESLWNEKKRRTTVNFNEIWRKFEKSMSDKKVNETGIPEEDENLDFEVVKSPLQDQEKLNELHEMLEILCRLSTECGLDAQGFVCKGCKSPLVEISKATVCGFDAQYYCYGCVSNDKFAIPAKIIFNWDFTPYNVSKRCAEFFADHQFKPFIDFKVK